MPPITQAHVIIPHTPQVHLASSPPQQELCAHPTIHTSQPAVRGACGLPGWWGDTRWAVTEAAGNTGGKENRASASIVMGGRLGVTMKGRNRVKFPGVTVFVSCPRSPRTSRPTPSSGRFKSTHAFSLSRIGCWSPREGEDQSAFSPTDKCFSHPALCAESLTSSEIAVKIQGAEQPKCPPAGATLKEPLYIKGGYATVKKELGAPG